MEHDPARGNYWRRRYPTPDDWQVIRDMRVIEGLKKCGDDQDVVRKMEHWSYFPDEAAAKRFADWAMSDRFTHDPAKSGPGDNGKFCVYLYHVGVTRTRPLSSYTCALRRKAEELGGEYDGWETHAVQSPHEPRD